MKERVGAGEMLNRGKICQRLGNNTCGRAPVGGEVGKHFSYYDEGESEKYLSKGESEKYFLK